MLFLSLVFNNNVIKKVSILFYRVIILLANFYCSGSQFVIEKIII